MTCQCFRKLISFHLAGLLFLHCVFCLPREIKIGEYPLTSYGIGIVHGTNRLSNELVVIVYRYDFKNLLHVAKTYGSASAYVYHVGKKFKTLFIL